MNMEFIRKLTIPAEVKQMYPLTAEMERLSIAGSEPQ